MSRFWMCTLTRWTLAASVAIAPACGDGGGMDGPPGQSGAPGAPSPTEQHGNHGALLWKDATGKTLGSYLAVSDIGGASFPFIYALLDAQGITWRVSPLAGTVDDFGVVVRSYTTTDCTGDVYLRTNTIVPRWAVEMPDKGYGTIKDSVTPQKGLIFRSFLDSARQDRCTEGIVNVGIPATYLPTDFIPVQTPPTGAAPFHIESLP